MKKLVVLLSFVLSANAYAADAFQFNCNVGTQSLVSLDTIDVAPENFVVSVNVTVLEEQVPLYLIQANVTEGESAFIKSFFATDWVAPTQLSSKGSELLALLSFFYPVDVSKVKRLRAATPTDILDDLAYVEIENNDGSLLKLMFQGINPQECQ